MRGHYMFNELGLEWHDILAKTQARFSREIEIQTGAHVANGKHLLLMIYVLSWKLERSRDRSRDRIKGDGLRAQWACVGVAGDI